MQVPVPMLTAGQDGKLGVQSAVKTLHWSITLSLFYAQPLADLAKYATFKVLPLVTVLSPIRCIETAEHFAYHTQRGWQHSSRGPLTSLDT